MMYPSSHTRALLTASGNVRVYEGYGTSWEALVQRRLSYGEELIPYLAPPVEFVAQVSH